MPSLYLDLGCIHTANPLAPSNTTAIAFNDLISNINARSGVASTIAPITVMPIDMDSIACSYEQLQHAIPSGFQQLCILQTGKFKKDGVDRNKGNDKEGSLSTLISKGHALNARNRDIR